MSILPFLCVCVVVVVVSVCIASHCSYINSLPVEGCESVPDVVANTTQGMLKTKTGQCSLQLRETLAIDREYHVHSCSLHQLSPLFTKSCLAPQTWVMELLDGPRGIPTEALLYFVATLSDG
jgi:hypothetical protein